MFADEFKTKHIFDRFVFALPFRSAEIHYRILRLKNSLRRVRVCCLKLDLLHVPAVAGCYFGADKDRIDVCIHRDVIRTNLCAVTFFPCYFLGIHFQSFVSSRIGSVSRQVSSRINGHRCDVIGVIQTQRQFTFGITGSSFDTKPFFRAVNLIGGPDFLNAVIGSSKDNAT